MLDHGIEKNIVAIVQARMGAHRLPNKMMLDFHGQPVIDWVFQRIQKTKNINRIVFALPNTIDDDSLAKHLLDLGAVVFRGSEADVVGRFYHAATKYCATHIVRICADNPFVSASEINRLVQLYFESNCDYAYNHIPKNNCYPDGIGGEIVSFQVLQDIYNEAKTVDHREHIFNFIWAYPDRFKILTFDPSDSRLAHPDMRLDINTKQDYEKLCRMKVDIEMQAHQIVAAAKALD